MRKKWTPEEFETLLNNDHLSHNELANKLGTRSAGAVEAVREAICSFHKGIKFSETALSEMMKLRLGKGQGFLSCPICGAKL
jgi:hypothetical protein